MLEQLAMQVIAPDFTLSEIEKKNQNKSTKLHLTKKSPLEVETGSKVDSFA